MSDPSPTAVVARFMEAFAAGDMDAMVRCCGDDFVSVDYSATASGIRGEYRGAPGMAEQMARFETVAEPTAFEVLELIGEGPSVAVRTSLAMTSKRTGGTYAGPMLVLCRVEDGLITRMETYPTEPETFYRDA